MTALDMDTTLIAVVEMSLSSWLVAGIVPGVAGNRATARALVETIIKSDFCTRRYPGVAEPTGDEAVPVPDLGRR